MPFVLCPIDIIGDHVYDYGFRSIHWSFVGSPVGKQLGKDNHSLFQDSSVLNGAARSKAL